MGEVMGSAIATTRNRMIRNIGAALRRVSLDSMTEKQLERLGQVLVIERAKDALHHAVKVNEFHYEEKKELFLKKCRSPFTRRNYSRAFMVFDPWLTENRLSPLEVNAQQADRFVLHLDSMTRKDGAPLSNGQKRVTLAALSAFYSQLVRWDSLHRNPWIGARRPDRIPARKIRALSDADYCRIMATFEVPATGRGRKLRTRAILRKWRAVFELLRTTGLRIGGVKTVEIGQNGRLSYIPKGKRGRYVHPEAVPAPLAAELRALDLSTVTESAIQKALKKACEKAGLDTAYNPHAFRHAYAVNYYGRTRDIYGLKERLGHSSISVTEFYLKTLKEANS